MQQEMLDKVRDIILEVIDVDREKITPQASLRDDLRADSLASVEIIMALEDEFGIQIDEQFARSLTTVRDLLDAIESMRNNACQRIGETTA
jgi:acyl carrier protein